jgi:hypothetical protein
MYGGKPDRDAQHTEQNPTYGPWTGLERLKRTPRAASPALELRARRGEWHARPLGRLGRRLLPEVERYLAFYAVARAE